VLHRQFRENSGFGRAALTIPAQAFSGRSSSATGRAQLPLARNLTAPDTETMFFDTEKRPHVIGYQYELETRSIRVAVKPAYLDDQSDPEDDRYVWSYTVTIENRGPEPVQLLSRYWNIVDGTGRVQEVRGAGVVGAQPVIAPGESFQYTSGCPLETASGTMSGRYQMMSASGESFEAEIPGFLLESPYERRQIH
jgi:ApaG protein